MIVSGYVGRIMVATRPGSCFNIDTSCEGDYFLYSTEIINVK